MTIRLSPSILAKLNVFDTINSALICFGKGILEDQSDRPYHLSKEFTFFLFNYS